MQLHKKKILVAILFIGKRYIVQSLSSFSTFLVLFLFLSLFPSNYLCLFIIHVSLELPLFLLLFLCSSFSLLYFSFIFFLFLSLFHGSAIRANIYFISPLSPTLSLLSLSFFLSVSLHLSRSLSFLFLSLMTGQSLLTQCCNCKHINYRGGGI